MNMRLNNTIKPGLYKKVTRRFIV